MAPLSRESSQLPGVRLTVLDLSIIKGAVLCLHEETDVFWVAICLPCLQSSASTVSEGTESFIYFHIISQTTLHKLFQCINKEQILSKSFYESGNISVSKHNKENMRKESWLISLMDTDAKLLNKTLANQTQQDT